MATRSRNRNVRRPAAPKAAGPTPSIHAAFTQLESRLSRVEKAFDHNTSVFHDAFKMFEVQQSVLFRILQDVFNGQVRVKGVTSNDDGIARATVDVDGYIQEHLEALTRAEETPKEEKAGPGPVLASENDDSPIEFGGDTP